MKDLRDELILFGLDTTKLDAIEEIIEAKKIYKVYIFYQFFDWEDTIEQEKFVLYTEDESLANDYYNLLQDVKSALASRCDERNYFSVELEKMSMYKTIRERCPFCAVKDNIVLTSEALRLYTKLLR